MAVLLSAQLTHAYNSATCNEWHPNSTPNSDFNGSKHDHPNHSRDSEVFCNKGSDDIRRTHQ